MSTTSRDFANPGGPIIDPSRMVDSIKDMPLASLGPILRAILNKVADYRSANSGYIPPTVFSDILGIAGQYTCLETIPRIVDTAGSVKGYLLKQRGDQEQGWTGQYHIPGVAVIPRPSHDSLSAAQTRLEKEIDFISTEEWMSRRNQLCALGVETHYEPERNAECVTLLRALDISSQEFQMIGAQLPESWKFFPAPVTDGMGVVEHHVKTLAWVDRIARANFDLRDL